MEETSVKSAFVKQAQTLLPEAGQTVLSTAAAIIQTEQEAKLALDFLREAISTTTESVLLGTQTVTKYRQYTNPNLLSGTSSESYRAAQDVEEWDEEEPIYETVEVRDVSKALDLLANPQKLRLLIDSKKSN